MHHIFSELDLILRTGRTACYTALVETRGSTPQKSGAIMIVYPDGSQVGTLGGGCVEAEVKRRALMILDHGTAELLTFQLDSDYGWDDGLICGGRMKMLVDPIRPTDDLTYFRQLSDAILSDRACTEVVVIDSEKSGGHNGDRMLIDDTQRTFALRGTNIPPHSLLTNLKPLSDRPRPYVVDGLSFLPYLKRCRLIIVGAGHVGQKVAELAAAVDFDVWVVDDREEYCNATRFPQAKRFIVGPIDQVLSGLEIDSDTYCLIVTRGHNHDEEALYHLAETPARYVGLIGSRRKIKMIFEDLLQERIPRAVLEKVYAPLGFDIGSQTVAEIAISIMAELIAHRNLGHIPEQVRKSSLMDEIIQHTT